jgi:hypothetical protein
LVLTKSRRRDPPAIDYGTYWLIGEGDAYFIPAGARAGTMRPVGFSIDEIEQYLTTDPGDRD